MVEVMVKGNVKIGRNDGGLKGDASTDGGAVVKAQLEGVPGLRIYRYRRW